MSEKMTPKKRKAVQALLTTGDRRAACEAAGISPQTLYRWLRQPAFQAALAEAEQDALQSLQRRLVTLGGDAGDVLEQSMRPGEKTSDRLRAADVVLGRLLQLRELVELTRRIEALEQRLEERREK